jgi:hypothetical protein
MLARLPVGPLAASGAGEQAAFPLDHHPGHLVEACADQSDPKRSLAGRLPNPRPDPFRTDSGLAEPAAGDDRPDPPVAGRLVLAAARAPPPFLDDRPNRRRRQACQNPPQSLRRQPRQRQQHRLRLIPPLDFEGRGTVRRTVEGPFAFHHPPSRFGSGAIGIFRPFSRFSKSAMASSKLQAFSASRERAIGPSRPSRRRH